MPARAPTFSSATIPATWGWRRPPEPAASAGAVCTGAFQAEFRCSPSDYLTRFRIQRACQLLCHSTLSVSAVAVSAGFADPFYFSRAFRREVGCSPSAYRTQKTGGAESPDNKEDPV